MTDQTRITTRHDPAVCPVCAAWTLGSTAHDPAARPYLVTPAGRVYLFSRRVETIQNAQQA